MKAIFAFVCLVLVASSASAAICSDTCNKSCDLGNELCQTSPFFGKYCDKLHSLCGKRCGLGCKCTDLCGDQCSKELADCKAKNQGADVVQCVVAAPLCAYSCGAQCVVETIVQVRSQFQAKLGPLLQSLSGGAAAPAK